MNENTRKLTRFEAQLVADYIRRFKRIDLPSGWVALFRLSPSEVAAKYPMTPNEVIKAARREPEKEEA